MRKTFLMTLDISALVIIAAIVAVIAYSFRDAEFEIINETGETVFVVALWADQRMDIGSIAPGATRSFSVGDEAAMKFRVRYPGGREADSEEIYFTGGTRVLVRISRQGVTQRYDFES